MDMEVGRGRRTLSAQRRVSMTLLFWSLPVSPLLSHPIPELGGGGREIEERGQGLVCMQERKQ